MREAARPASMKPALATSLVAHAIFFTLLIVYTLSRDTLSLAGDVGGTETVQVAMLQGPGGEPDKPARLQEPAPQKAPEKPQEKATPAPEPQKEPPEPEPKPEKPVEKKAEVKPEPAKTPPPPEPKIEKKPEPKKEEPKKIEKKPPEEKPAEIKVEKPTPVPEKKPEPEKKATPKIEEKKAEKPEPTKETPKPAGSTALSPEEARKLRPVPKNPEHITDRFRPTSGASEAKPLAPGGGGPRTGATAGGNPLGRATKGGTTLKGLGLPDYYAKEALERVSKYFLVPPEQEQDLTATITLRVARNGALSNTRVERSSGNSELDQLALRAIEMTGQFPPFPDDFEREFADVEITFSFRR